MTDRLSQVLTEVKGERSFRALERELGVSRSVIHRVMTGKQSVDVDPLYAALYRHHPEHRDTLEEWQRQVIVSKSDDQQDKEGKVVTAQGP